MTPEAIQCPAGLKSHYRNMYLVHIQISLLEKFKIQIFWNDNNKLMKLTFTNNRTDKIDSLLASTWFSIFCLHVCLIKSVKIKIY